MVMGSDEESAISSLVAKVPVPLKTLSSLSRGKLDEYLQQDDLTVADARTVWKSLLRSLRTSTLSEKQITSTCNCLRIFLRSISTAKSEDVRRIALVHDEWISCYDAVYDTWSRAKAKPLVQVLEVLVQIAKNGMSGDAFDSIWEGISFDLCAVILSGQPNRGLKRALGLSSFFLERELPYGIYIESARRNLRQTAKQSQGADTNDADTFKYLIRGVLLAFGQHDSQSSAEKCFKTLLKVDHASDTQSWWSLVRIFVADHADSFDTIVNSVFPVLLEQQQPNHCLDLVRSYPASGNKAALPFLLALLQSLREREMINQTGELSPHSTQRSIKRTLGSMMIG